MDSTYTDFGPTLFPTREDMTVAPYREREDKDVDYVDDVVDRLWQDPPAVPFDESATYGFHEDMKSDERMIGDAIMRLFGF